MKIQMTGRHLTVPAPVKRRLVERLEKLTRYVPELSEAQVKLSAEKYRHQAEILIHVRHTNHVSRAEAGDLESAIDAAVERLEAQVRRLKGKKSKRLAAHKAPDGPLRRSAARAALEDEAVKPLPRGNGKAPRVTVGRLRVVKDKEIGAKPMTVAQAASKLEESGAGFVVFVDSVSGLPCVLYLRADGQLALVEARA